MTSQTTVIRATAVSAMVAAALSWGASSEAADPVPASASIGAVTCVGEQGQFGVTLTAGDSAASFSVRVEDSFAQEHSYENRDLDAHGSEIVPIADLGDDDYTVAVDVYYYDGEGSGEDGDPVPAPTKPEVLVEDLVTVSCDPAPEGPYTNPRGILNSYCSDQIEVLASNRPIGGNTADLQPVEFTVTYLPSGDAPVDGEPIDEEPTDEPGDDASRSVALDPVVLDTFTLDATTPTFKKTYGTDGYEFTGAVSLTADGNEIAATEIGGCVVGSPTSGEAGGAGVPNTGA